MKQRARVREKIRKKNKYGGENEKVSPMSSPNQRIQRLKEMMTEFSKTGQTHEWEGWMNTVWQAGKK